MTSQYGIITIANLEARTSRDYSSYVDQANNRNYSDTNIEAWISQAERIICMYLGKSYDSSAPQSVIYCAIELAKVIADNQLIEDGIIQNRQTMEPVLTPAMLLMLDNMTKAEQATGRIKQITSVEDY